MRRWSLTAVASLAVCTTTALGGAQALTPTEVWASVDEHHPRVQEALAEQDVAVAQLLNARGEFDPRLRAEGKARTGGYYDLRRFDAELAQPTTFWGTELFAGYRIGRALDTTYPTYLPDETLSGGEFRAGARVPLLRGRQIDAARAGLAQTRARIAAAEQGVAIAELELKVAAAEAYWKWVAAGKALQLAGRMLELAETRHEQLQEKVEAGAVARVELLDAQRAVLDRGNQRLLAAREWQRTGYLLSLYLRDSQGQPLVPDLDAVPESPAVGRVPVAPGFTDELLRCHPALQQLRARLDEARVDIDLAENQLLPELMAEAQVSRDVGSADSPLTSAQLTGTVYQASLSVDIPVLFRGPRGALAAARARRSALQAEQRWLRLQLQQRIRDLVSEARMAEQRAEITAELEGTAQEVAEAERERFDLGASNVLTVNLREQAAAEGEVAHIRALSELGFAASRWTLLRGLCPRRPSASK